MSFYKDKILGYSLLGIVGQCFQLKKQDWITLFKGKMEFEESLYQQYSGKEFLDKVYQNVLDLGNVIANPVPVGPTASQASQAKEAVEQSKNTETVDFSSFF